MIANPLLLPPPTAYCYVLVVTKFALLTSHCPLWELNPTMFTQQTSNKFQSEFAARVYYSGFLFYIPISYPSTRTMFSQSPLYIISGNQLNCPLVVHAFCPITLRRIIVLGERRILS